MTFTKQIRIYPGVDIDRAMRCIGQYVVSENAQRTGDASLTIYTNGTDEVLAVYTTSTAYIIRKAE
jgi:hypothetical protein